MMTSPEAGRSQFLSATRTLLTAVALLTSAPAFAQVDLTGFWAARNHEDLEGMLPGDYAGLPINDEARARADAFTLSYLALPERQCIMYTSHYVVRGPQSLQISSEIDPISGRVVAWRTSGAVDRNPRTIWMDGRPHPSPLARHTAAGFSTGTWQGEALLVTTTHLTEGVLSHNGVPSSNQATIREYIVRRGDHLMITMIVYDPIYLEEPYLRSRTWVYRSFNPRAPRTVRACIGAGQTGWRGAALPAWNEPISRRTHGEVQHPARCAPWRRGRPVPGIPQATSGPVRASLARTHSSPARSPPVNEAS